MKRLLKRALIPLLIIRRATVTIEAARVDSQTKTYIYTRTVGLGTSGTLDQLFTRHQQRLVLFDSER